MFCPQCRVEYRPGFTHCTDCDVDLVAELPLEPQSASDFVEGKWDQKTLQDDELKVVWEGDSASECEEVCRSLQKNEIPYRFNQSEAGRGPKMRVDFHYQVAVGIRDHESARTALGYSVEDETMWTEQEVESGAAELPAQNDRPVEEVHGDWNSSRWFPEDATQEIWSGNPKTSGSIVEMSLMENRINYRVELLSDELKKVFVLPEDEARAREIVREIVEGVPPE